MMYSLPMLTRRGFLQTTGSIAAIAAFRDEGIEFSGSNTYDIVPWNEVNHWSETTDAVFLFGRSGLVGLYLSLVVGKAQLSVDDSRFLKQRLEEHNIRKR